MASEKAHAFYHPDPTPLDRARRAAYAASLRDAFRDGFCIWVLCTWCGHTRLTEPGFTTGIGKLAQQMKQLITVRNPEQSRFGRPIMTVRRLDISKSDQFQQMCGGN